MKWFPRFPRIRSKPSKTPELPYSSSLEQVEALKALRKHPAWKHLQALLERVAQSEYDRLAGGLAYEDYHAQVGKYHACRGIVELVDTLIEKADAHDARHRTSDEHERAHRTSITVNSPHYKP